MRQQKRTAKTRSWAPLYSHTIDISRHLCDSSCAITAIRDGSMGLDLDFRLHGSRAVPVTAEYVRDITPADVAFLAETARTNEIPKIKKLRDSHHVLAMCLARGLSETQSAAVAGYSLSRVSILKLDPSFQGLVEHYRNEVVEGEIAEMDERMRSLGKDFIDELRERLEENPEGFSVKDLMAGITKFADRTGFGPQTKSVNVNLHADLAETLQNARERRLRGDGGDQEPA